MRSEPVVEGSFERITMDEILGIVSISRQCLDLVFDEEQTGKMTIKAGLLLEASSSRGERGRDAFFSLYERPGDRFAVYQRDMIASDMSPIEALTTLVESAQQMSSTQVYASRQAFQRTDRESVPAKQDNVNSSSDIILAGSFSDFSLADVIRVASISRQPLLLSTTRANGTSCLLQIKSGLLVACRAPAVNEPAKQLVGADAFQSVVQDPGLKFVVTREQFPLSDKPIGDLVALMAPPRPTLVQSPPSTQPRDPNTSTKHPSKAPASSPERPSAPLPAAAPAAPAAPALQAPGNTERELIVQGQFSDFPLKDVLSTLSLTRQTIEFIVRDSQGPRGGMLIKAGQLLDVRTKQPSKSAREAFNDLITNPGDMFALFRRSGPTQYKPLGTLAEWLADAQRVVQMPVRKIIIDGMLNQFSLNDVLSVLSTSRQRMVLELWDSGRPRGRLVVKANMVLEVTTADQRSGEPALRAILYHPGDRFVVATEPGTRSSTSVIGTLDQLLAEASRTPEEPSQRTASAPSVPAPSISAPLSSPRTSLPPNTTLSTSTSSSEQLLLEGDLSDFTISEVLSVMTLSRHCLELRIKRRNSAGAMLRVKASQVLGASLDGERDPVRVLHSVLTSPNESFAIVRVPVPPGAVPIGALDLLFVEAQGLGDSAATLIDLDVQDPSLREPPRSARSDPAIARPSRSERSQPPNNVRRQATPVVLPERISRPQEHQTLEQRGASEDKRIEDRPTLIPSSAGDPRFELLDPRVDAIEHQLQRTTEQLGILERAVADRRLETELNEALVLVRLLEKRIEEQHVAIETARSAPRRANDLWLTLSVLAVQLLTVFAVVLAVGLSVFSWNP